MTCDTKDESSCRDGEQHEVEEYGDEMFFRTHNQNTSTSTTRTSCYRVPLDSAVDVGFDKDDTSKNKQTTGEKYRRVPRTNRVSPLYFQKRRRATLRSVLFFVMALLLLSLLRTTALLTPRNNNHGPPTTRMTEKARETRNTTRLNLVHNKNATLFTKRKPAGLSFISKWSAKNNEISRLGAVVESSERNELAPEPLIPPSPHSESVHLRLASEAMMHRVEEDTTTKNGDDDPQKQTTTTTQKALLHIYRDPVSKRVLLKGLNMTRRKFCAWVNYTLANTDSLLEDAASGRPFDESCVSTEQVQVDDQEVKDELRRLWKERRLLSERTEVLAVYKSDKEEEEQPLLQSDNKKKKKKKRGGFPDLLHLYAERLAAIIQDELEEEQIATGQLKVFNDTVHHEERPVPSSMLEILNGGLLGWLQREYGVAETKELDVAHFKPLPEKKKFEILQRFMDWFRNRFPYYYDRCDHCGASAKDDPEPETNDDNKDQEEVVDEDDDGSSFLGYVYPTPDELVGKASRTEIYQCHKCGGFTRFPRYNSASSIINNSRGRCGEYSMLLFRLLRAAGHEARWIVDWADHVWAEVRLNGRWIHLDPCEAAVDKPLLYQEWGKQQTYIVAFRAPRSTLPKTSTPTTNRNLPLIEDVTTKYTSDHVDEIQKRREESTGDVKTTVGKITNDLELLLKNILQ